MKLAGRRRTVGGEEGAERRGRGNEMVAAGQVGARREHEFGGGPGRVKGLEKGRLRQSAG